MSTEFRFDRQKSSSQDITILKGKGEQRGTDKGREEQVVGGPVRLGCRLRGSTTSLGSSVSSRGRCMRCLGHKILEAEVLSGPFRQPRHLIHSLHHKIRPIWLLGTICSPKEGRNSKGERLMWVTYFQVIAFSFHTISFFEAG